MIMSNTITQIKIGWRALVGFSGDRELQTISVATNLPLNIRAGRLTKDNLEVVLFGFSLQEWPATRVLPHGKGFDIRIFEIESKKYLGISRGSGGSLELFESMITDVIEHIFNLEGQTHALIFKKFVDRVRDWQNFMSRGRSGLSRADEIGLFGELLILNNLLDSNVPTTEVLDWWKGPLHGRHDYHINGGGLEVKSTTSEEGFIIDVFDISQLDPALVEALFLFGIRLKVDQDGKTLPDMVNHLRERLQNNTSALFNFDKCLGFAGYDDEHISHYNTKYQMSEIVGFEVNASFPSLRIATLSPEIFEVRYRLDLNSIHQPKLTQNETLKKLGVIVDGTI